MGHIGQVTIDDSALVTMGWSQQVSQSKTSLERFDSSRRLSCQLTPGMLFLTLSNADIRFAEKEFVWRSYVMQRPCFFGRYQRAELLIHRNLQPWCQTKAFSPITLPSFTSVWALLTIRFPLQDFRLPQLISCTIILLSGKACANVESCANAEPPHLPHQFKDFANVPLLILWPSFPIVVRLARLSSLSVYRVQSTP